MRILLLSAFIYFLLFYYRVEAAFEYSPVSPDMLFPFVRAIEMDEIYGCNPAYLGTNRSTAINASTERPYGLVELHSYQSSIQLCNHTSGLGIQWIDFGIDEFREERVSLRGGHCFWSQLSFGIDIIYYSLSINTEEYTEQRDYIDYTCGVVYTPFDWFSIGVLQTNLKTWYNSKITNLVFPEFSFGIGVQPITGLFISGNHTRTVFGPVNSVSISANLLKYFKVSLGYAPEAHTTSASFAVIWKRIKVSYGLRLHTFLGYTQGLGVAVSYDSRSFQSISFNKKAKSGKRVKPVNINSSSYGELMSVPGMKDLYARRIIRYRETIGPVTRDSLIQIGLEPFEAKEIIPYFYGFVKKRSYKRRKRWHHNKRYKWKPNVELFQKLLAHGVSAPDALELCKLKYYGKKSKLAKKIESLECSSEIKKVLLSLCGLY